jgi:hypothetical protein
MSLKKSLFTVAAIDISVTATHSYPSWCETGLKCKILLSPTYIYVSSSFFSKRTKSVLHFLVSHCYARIFTFVLAVVWYDLNPHSSFKYLSKQI